MAGRLASVESRNVTHLSEDWPIFWEEARSANVRDVDGNVYIDLTSAFGVALLGHGSPALLRALEGQRGLVHGMGDVHPPAKKLELLERLASVSPWPDTRVVLSGSGSEAVETALKTAQLASGRPGILAFRGGYHGLTLGSLAVTERSHFRAPFAERVYGGVAFAPFPDPVREGEKAAARSLETVKALLDAGAPNGDPIGTLVVEPVQARGGARIPPPGYMAGLTELASQHDVLVVADEIFTGMGRCGSLLASARVGLEPDLVCVGKALGAGLPISACMAPAEIMDAWPESDGEAIHTSTFLGHPLACAAALGVLEELETGDVRPRARALGATLVRRLGDRLERLPAVGEVRGLGLLVGIELVEPGSMRPREGAAARLARSALREGLILLPAGDHGHVVQLTPPVTVTDDQVGFVVEALDRCLQALP
ncbi:MAG: aspartate aminotransferase family protein [Longimicrobiales bacterium]|nr:aspartate aminotransferase family protein [Longimicrobiales bacterium]